MAQNKASLWLAGMKQWTMDQKKATTIFLGIMWRLNWVAVNQRVMKLSYYDQATP